MTQAVVLDIGNVLIRWDPEGFYDRRLGRPRREQLFAEVPLWEMNDQVDRGAPFRESVEELAAVHPDWAAEVRLWHDGWLEMTAADKPLSVALLRALRERGVPVWALSNFGAEPLALAEATYPFLVEFDRRFISCELGIAKPDLEIYAAVESQGLAPDRLLFTDDRPENIAAAEARGWRTHLFDGEAGWAARLVEEGLLPEEAAT